MRSYSRVIDNVYTVWFVKSSILKSDFVRPTSYRLEKWVENDGICQWRDLREYYGKHMFSATTAQSYSQNIFNKMSPEVHNMCLRKFDEKASSIDNLYEAWHERQTTLDQLTDITEKLLTFCRYWKDPRYWKHLKGSFTPSTLPDAWLQWQFGLKPLIGTFDSAFKFLGSPLYGTTVKASGRSSTSGLLVRDGHSLNYQCTYIERMQAKLMPNSNPNARLLKIAGLNEPFSTAFSVIPWGWAVDYFVNASEMMSNFENKHPGVIFLNAQTANVYKFSWSGHHQSRDRYKNPLYLMNGDGYTFSRSLGIDGSYKPEFRFPLLGSNQAANLLSALALTMNKAK